MQSREYTFKQEDEVEALLADVHWQPNLAGQGHLSRPIGLSLSISINHLKSCNVDDVYGGQVIIFHGGGFVQGSKAIIPKTQITTLARFGFIVVVPNYRLCPHISVYDGPLADSLECMRWTAYSLPDKLFRDVGICIDANRITLMGHSSGGSLALLAVRLSPFRVQFAKHCSQNL